MSEPQNRVPEETEEASGTGGENVAPPSRDEVRDHASTPHDRDAHEPLGPVTPDDERPVGDTPEAHDEIIPEDLPKDHPGRAEAERQATEGGDGVAHGNV